MIPLILITASLTCSEANVLVDKMKTYDVEDNVKSEMIQVVKDEVSEECWDAND